MNQLQSNGSANSIGGGIGGSSASNDCRKNCAVSTPRICWDFVRGNCRRKNCRYPHVLSVEMIVFCHDYQNSSCPRINCKFLHYTLQEEEYYRKFGEFPLDCNNGTMDNDICNGGGGNNNNGNGRHKFMGAQQQQMDDMSPYGAGAPASFVRQHQRECFMNAGARAPQSAAAAAASNRFEQSIHHHNGHGWNDHHAAAVYRAANERSLLPLSDFHPCDEFQALKRTSLDAVASFKRFRDDSDRVDVMQVIRRFEEEQSILRRRVEANEIKIAELRASNEYLMAQLRLNTQQCSNVVNPVTVTQTTSTPQVIGAVSIAPVQVQATPIVSIATPQTQIITNSGTPLAIAAAAASSQGQQLAIAQQNITSLSNAASQTLQPTHTQQILGTSQITLAPAGLSAAPSMGLTINTSQAALAMSNASQPIISYPIMTHSILPH